MISSVCELVGCEPVKRIYHDYMVTDSKNSPTTPTSHLRLAQPLLQQPQRLFSIFQETPPIMLAGLTLATAGASVLSVLGVLPKG